MHLRKVLKLLLTIDVNNAFFITIMLLYDLNTRESIVTHFLINFRMLL